MVKPILTLTLNPSVDISYQLPTLSLDTVNRVTTVSKTAGGKGLNVARVLSLLDQEVYASGFLGGTLGKFISQALPSLIQTGLVSIFVFIIMMITSVWMTLVIVGGFFIKLQLSGIRTALPGFIHCVTNDPPVENKIYILRKPVNQTVCF